MAIRTHSILAAGLALVGLGVALAACMQDGARQSSASATPQATTPGFGLYYMDEGASAKLAYGRANSDEVDLMLQCAKGSRTVEVTDASSTAEAPSLILASNGRTDSVAAHREDSGEGGVILVATTRSDAPALSAFRRSGQLQIDHADVHHGLTATADERVGVERFFTACESRSLS